MSRRGTETASRLRSLQRLAHGRGAFARCVHAGLGGERDHSVLPNARRDAGDDFGLPRRPGLAAALVRGGARRRRFRAAAAAARLDAVEPQNRAPGTPRLRPRPGAQHRRPGRGARHPALPRQRHAGGGGLDRGPRPLAPCRIRRPDRGNPAPCGDGRHRRERGEAPERDVEGTVPRPPGGCVLGGSQPGENPRPHVESRRSVQSRGRQQLRRSQGLLLVAGRLRRVVQALGHGGPRVRLSRLHLGWAAGAGSGRRRLAPVALGAGSGRQGSIPRHPARQGCPADRASPLPQQPARAHLQGAAVRGYRRRQRTPAV